MFPLFSSISITHLPPFRKDNFEKYKEFVERYVPKTNKKKKKKKKFIDRKMKCNKKRKKRTERRKGLFPSQQPPNALVVFGRFSFRVDSRSIRYLRGENPAWRWAEGGRERGSYDESENG
jgi:hypothetical protein